MSAGFVFIGVKKKDVLLKSYVQKFATASATVINSQKPHCLPVFDKRTPGGAARSKCRMGQMGANENREHNPFS